MISNPKNGDNSLKLEDLFGLRELPFPPFSGTKIEGKTLRYEWLRSWAGVCRVLGLKLRAPQRKLVSSKENLVVRMWRMRDLNLLVLSELVDCPCEFGDEFWKEELLVFPKSEGCSGEVFLSKM